MNARGRLAKRRRLGGCTTIISTVNTFSGLYLSHDRICPSIQPHVISLCWRVSQLKESVLKAPQSTKNQAPRYPLDEIVFGLNNVSHSSARMLSSLTRLSCTGLAFKCTLFENGPLDTGDIVSGYVCDERRGFHHWSNKRSLLFAHSGVHMRDRLEKLFPRFGGSEC